MLGAIVGTWLLAKILRVVMVRMARRTNNRWDDRLAGTLAAPLSVLAALWTFAVVLPWLAVDPRLALYARDLTQVISVIAVVWALFRGIDLARVVRTVLASLEAILRAHPKIDIDNDLDEGMYTITLAGDIFANP